MGVAKDRLPVGRRLRPQRLPPAHQLRRLDPVANAGGRRAVRAHLSARELRALVREARRGVVRGAVVVLRGGVGRAGLHRMDPVRVQPLHARVRLRRASQRVLRRLFRPIRHPTADGRARVLLRQRLPVRRALPRETARGAQSRQRHFRFQFADGGGDGARPEAAYGARATPAAAGLHAVRDRRGVRRLLDAQRRRLHVGRRVADHPAIRPRPRHVAGVRQLEHQQRLVRRPKPELPARLQRPLSDGVLLRDAPQEGVAVLP